MNKSLFISLLSLINFVFTQSVQEKIDAKIISFSQFEMTDKSFFLAIPDDEFEILENKDIQFELSFKKGKSRFIEINSFRKSSVLKFKFKNDISSYFRANDPISVNRIFLSQKQLRKINQKNDYRTKNTTLKIYTDKESVYKLDFSYFKKNGISIDNIPINNLRLFNKDKEIPILIESGNDNFINQINEFIVFYATYNLNTNFPETVDLYFDPYDYRNVYFLTTEADLESNPPLRLYYKNALNIENNDELIFRPKYFNRKLHKEVNKILANQQIPRIESQLSGRSVFHHRDFWLWGVVDTGKVSYFDINELDNHYREFPNDSAEVSVMLSGGATLNSNKHEVTIRIGAGSFTYNNDPNWILSYQKKINFKLPLNQILSQNNQLGLEILSQNQIVLNWVDINFKSKLIANQTFDFTFSAIKPEAHPEAGKKYSAYEYVVKNIFTDKYRFNVFNKNNGLLKSTIIRPNETNFELVFQDEITNQNSEFILFFQFLEPLKINKVSSYKLTSLKNTISNAEMLIICPEVFYSKALEYAEFKQTQNGIKTEVIDADWIYNEFNEGLQSPVAIRNFIKYAYENWSNNQSLKYVMLVGDAERNYFLGNQISHTLPTFQFITETKGFVNSDPYFGYLYHYNENRIDFNNNPIMDVVIGRIPAESVTELDAYLQKVKEFENAPIQNKSLILTGNDFNQSDPINVDMFTGQRVFVGQASRINHNIIDENLFSILRRASTDSIVPTSNNLESTVELQNLFNSGLNYISFFGHGSGAQWGDKNILLKDDAKALQNRGKYPFVGSFTCFIGAFDGGRTLGEELILQRNKGAMAVYGASGVSLVYNQYMMGYFVNEYVYQKKYSFADAINLGKFKYFLKGANYITDSNFEPTPQHYTHKYFLLMEFNFLGDPTLKIKFPETINFTLSDSLISENKTIKYKFPNVPASDYNIEIEAYDLVGKILYKSKFSKTINTETEDSINFGQLSNENIVFIKGSLADNNNNVYNFGKKLIKKNSNIENINFEFIENESENPTQLIAGKSYKLKTSNKKIASLSCRIKIFKFDDTRFDDYSLNFSKVGNDFISNEVFFVRNDAGTADIINIQGLDTNLQTIQVRHKSYQVVPTNYLVQPNPNSLKIQFDSHSNLSVDILYALSILDSLKTKVSYYRKELNQITFLISDTITFYKNNSTINSKVKFKENYDGGTYRYFIKVEGLSTVNPIDTVYQSLSSDLITLPNQYIDKDKRLIESQPDSNIFTYIYLEENLIKNDGSLLNIKQSNSLYNDNYIKNILINKQIDFYIYNNKFEIFSGDSSNFKIKFKKNIWKNNFHESLYLLVFDKSVNSWMQMTAYMELLPDSTLVFKAKNGFNTNYASIILAKDYNLTNEINLISEINGAKSDSVIFTSLNPQIKIILNSSYKVINFKNIYLTMLHDNFEENIRYSYVYSGNQNRTLILILENNETLNQDGKIKLNLKVDENSIIKNNGKILLNNNYSQSLNLNGTDNLFIYGNYPNPFGKKTIFAMQISSSESAIEEIDLEIKIFTINGFLIRSYNKNTLVKTGADYIDIIDNSSKLSFGYNYFSWDGKDENSIDVANGVYFVKFIFKSGGKVIEKIIKVAKLNGYSN